MRNTKIRRHSGRVTPRLNKGIRVKECLDNALEPKEYWDDWINYRGGFRGSDDRKMIRNPYIVGSSYLKVKRWNEKLKKLIIRGKARKLARNNNSRY